MDEEADVHHCSSEHDSQDVPGQGADPPPEDLQQWEQEGSGPE